MTGLQADLVDHGLDGSLLELAAKGHQHSAGADGGVKALGKSALGAGVQIGGNTL